ncbi:MAG: hypothetical protein ACFFDK_04830 [Promethearchaeota archaeon]
MAEDFQKKKIEELETELELKNKEISSYLDRIEYLEDTIMEIEESLSNKTKKSEDLLLKFQLKELEKNYRELKDRLGYLRKENVNLKIELEKLNKINPESSSIKIITRNPLSDQVITSIAKDVVYIENELKKTNMNKEEIVKKLRHFMKIIRDG